jgi:hypothetical protein
MFLWKLGCFYDNRSEQWKLIQDGKLIFAGTGYRVVRFRNRFFFIDDVKGILGYCKHSEAVGHRGEREYLDDVRTFPEQSFAELYACISDFTRKNDDYVMSKPDDGYGMISQRGEGFFTDDDGHFKPIEEKYPTTVVLNLPKGLRWIRRAVDAEYSDNEQYEKKEGRNDNDRDRPTRLHGERYTLENKKGEKLMRAEFDDEDDCLKSIQALNTQEEDDHRRLHNSVFHLTYLSDDQKKDLFALMSALNKKLTPQQAREAGYYRLKNGKFKAFAGNKMLEGYLDGLIIFPDGHAFAWDKYDKEWELGTLNPKVNGTTTKSSTNT